MITKIIAKGKRPAKSEMNITNTKKRLIKDMYRQVRNWRAYKKSWIVVSVYQIKKNHANLYIRKKTNSVTQKT